MITSRFSFALNHLGLDLSLKKLKENRGNFGARHAFIFSNSRGNFKLVTSPLWSITLELSAIADPQSHYPFGFPSLLPLKRARWKAGPHAFYSHI
jgi:hypothetical protein